MTAQVQNHRGIEPPSLEWAVIVSNKKVPLITQSLIFSWRTCLLIYVKIQLIIWSVQVSKDFTYHTFPNFTVPSNKYCLPFDRHNLCDTTSENRYTEESLIMCLLNHWSNVFYQNNEEALLCRDEPHWLICKLCHFNCPAKICFRCNRVVLACLSVTNTKKFSCSNNVGTWRYTKGTEFYVW